MKRVTAILSASGLVLALSLPSWAQTALPTHNVTLAGTVETIDHGKRIVTIRTADGKFETIDVPPSAKRFDELKVGDKVSVTYNNNVSVRPKPPGEPPVDTGSKTSTMGQEVRPGGTTVGAADGDRDRRLDRPEHVGDHLRRAGRLEIQPPCRRSGGVREGQGGRPG